MIKCFKEIQNLGVYKNFIWDQSIYEINKDSKVKKDYFFTKVNIIYGQNYAGKTTLSRLVMGLKTGYLSQKYTNPSFKIQLRNDSVIDQNNFLLHQSDIRVFNQDFISDNLSLLFDENLTIKSFAVLGEKNNEVEKKISNLKAELGVSNEEDSLNTGLYAQARLAYNEREMENKELNKIINEKDRIFMNKSTRDKNSIKSEHYYFGNNTLNYTKTRLETDIKNTDDSSLLHQSTIEKLRIFIEEEEKNIIQEVPSFNTSLVECQNKAKELLSKEMSVSQSIQELLLNNDLNQWVRSGKHLHEKEDKCKCLFCGNDINDSLWKKLDDHYNQKSEDLLYELNALDMSLEDVIAKFDKTIPFEFDHNKLYSEFRLPVKPIQDEINKTLKKAHDIAKEIQVSVSERVNNINKVVSFEEKDLNFFAEANKKINELNALIESSNSKTRDIDNEKNDSKTKLFESELASFKKHINYDDMISNIDQKQENYEVKKDAYADIYKKIYSKRAEIEELKRERINEKRGADEINNILCNNLGHPNLELIPVKNSNGCHYIIVRDGETAYHLSEGEKSLIAFCYFIADLDNINADKSNRVIWIDDPISSLDSGHIFYIYSIIKDRITSKEDNFKQFFISTHNLDFLKLSKRLVKRPNFYMIDKGKKSSTIKRMPNYLMVYNTEFNYIFENIYRCASEQQNDDNFNLFFNFGNNCRKFIEIYLAFKFPDSLDTAKERDNKMKILFGDSLSAFFADRLNNEYSHLTGNFERGFTPIYQEEVSKTAKLVLDVIKREDSRQFQSLVDSLTINKEYSL